METQWSNVYGVQKNSSKGEVYSNTNLPQETRKISNKQSNFTAKGTRKEEQTQPNVGRCEEIIMIINSRKIIKIIKSRNKWNRDWKKNHGAKSWFFKKKKKIDTPLARLIKEKERAK